MFDIKKYFLSMNYEEYDKNKKNIDSLQQEINNFQIEFDKIHFYKYNDRVLCNYEGYLKPQIALYYLKDKINRSCSVHFQDRTTIMKQVFDEIDVVKKIQDFSIIRFDFKQYFYSISNDYVIKKYLLNNKLLRDDLDLLSMFSNAVPYSCAGLGISNTFAELLARNFDLEIKTLLKEYGILLYTRYVDDGLIFLNKYIDQSKTIELLNSAIYKVFFDNSILTKYKNKTQLNMTKTKVINKRNISTINSFDFLGYKFTFNNDMDFEYGITNEKIDKYTKRIEKLISRINSEGNPDKLRIALKTSASRIVYCFETKTKYWVSKGIIQNYCMLREKHKSIDSNTMDFLNNIYKNSFANLEISMPGYLNSPRYNLYNSLVDNKSIIFDDRIGYKYEDLKGIHSIVCGSTGTIHKDYVELTKDILIELGIGY